jgi:cholesterol transport system auxiliary component
MVRNKIVLILLLGLPLILGACLNLAQPKNKVEYYTLEYDPPMRGDLLPLSCTIRVEPFSVSPIYNSNRIIYRDRSFKRQAYTYYKWRANPGNLVTYFLGRDMQQSGLFKAVLPGSSKFPATFVLEGTVDEFLETDTPNGWEAKLSVSVAFMGENESDISKKVLFQKTYHTNRSCRQKHPRALAEAMSLAMSKVSGEIINDIYSFFDKF